MKNLIVLISATLSFSFAQDELEKKKLNFIFEPDSLSLNIGEAGTVAIKLVDENGDLSNNPFYVYGTPRRSLESSPRISDSTGTITVTVKPYKPGNLKLAVRSIAKNRSDRVYGCLLYTSPSPRD